MIVLDTSAIIAVLEDEPERERFSRTIEQADRRVVSAVTLQEAGFVLIGRKGPQALRNLLDYLVEIDAEIHPHDEALARLALEAFARYGKGIDPRARLNFGDCAAYALARHLGAALLFKGDDFAATDIAPA